MPANLAERLVSARKMAGLSLQDLSDKIESGITKQAINKYEKGKVRPSSEILLQIARVLNVPIDYFYRTTSVELNDIDFRKHTRLLKRDIDRIKGECCDFLERYLELENLLNIQSEFKSPLTDNVIRGHADIERVAEVLRKEWGLGLSPIPSVVEMLEERRVKVFEVIADHSFSGMSTWVKGIPVVVLNGNTNPQRKRFTALHELAHLLLDLSAFDEKTQERHCNNFAGAFLVPGATFLEWFGEKRTSISLNELVLIDENFGISVQAIMYRAYVLGIISEPTHREFSIWLSKSNNRKNEFVTFCGKEQPQRFIRLLYKAITESVISMSKAAILANKKLADFRDEIIAVG
jgi:Zn-dependent peptidase ImmA (M78 family)/transcriptional regulator with XRE-family HTH domain